MAGNANSGRLGKNTKMVTESKPIFTAKCPKALNKRAKLFWKRYVDLLTPRNVIEDKDARALERLCIMQDLFESCIEFVYKNGPTVVEPNQYGEVTRERVESKMAKQYIAIIKDLERRFGLTPKDGEGIKTMKLKKTRESVRDKY